MGILRLQKVIDLVKRASVRKSRQAWRMQVVTISSRYVIFNNSPEYLQFGQRNANLAWQLAPGSRMPFHWDDATGKPDMCLRPAAGSWNWSGAFSVSSGTLRFPNSLLPKYWLSMCSSTTESENVWMQLPAQATRLSPDDRQVPAVYSALLYAA